MLSQMVFIHITLLLLDPHDIHHEGKKMVSMSDWEKITLYR